MVDGPNGPMIDGPGLVPDIQVSMLSGTSDNITAGETGTEPVEAVAVTLTGAIGLPTVPMVI